MFNQSSHIYRSFVADASKAEFSRHGNPLYQPNHTPVQLPMHVMDGSLDIKIPEYSVKKNGSSDEKSSLDTTQVHRDTGLISNSGGMGMRPHENGTCKWSSTSAGTQVDSAGGMETQERENDAKSAPLDQNIRT